MIPGFGGCTPIYNNHATTAFSMVLTPSRLVHPIICLIFVSYPAVVKKQKMFLNPIMIPRKHPSSHPSDSFIRQQLQSGNLHLQLPPQSSNWSRVVVKRQIRPSQRRRPIWHFAGRNLRLLTGGGGRNLTRVHSSAVSAITIWQLEAQCQDIQACHSRWHGYCHHFMVIWFWCEIIANYKL